MEYVITREIWIADGVLRVRRQNSPRDWFHSSRGTVMSFGATALILIRDLTPWSLSL